MVAWKSKPTRKILQAAISVANIEIVIAIILYTSLKVSLPFLWVDLFKLYVTREGVSLKINKVAPFSQWVVTLFHPYVKTITKQNIRICLVKLYKFIQHTYFGISGAFRAPVAYILKEYVYKNINSKMLQFRFFVLNPLKNIRISRIFQFKFNHML